MLPASAKIKQLVVGAVNPRLTQFNAALALALFIGAVVGAAVVGITVNITTTCEKTCSGLPLHIAASEGGECESTYVEGDLAKLPLPAQTKDLFYAASSDSWQRAQLHLKITSFNGTVSKTFDFDNLKCKLPPPSSLTTTYYADAFGGSTTSQHNIKGAHAAHVDASSSTRFTITPNDGTLTCCNSAVGGPRPGIYESPTPKNEGTDATILVPFVSMDLPSYYVREQPPHIKTWDDTLKQAEEAELLCLHFDIINSGQFAIADHTLSSKSGPPSGKGFYDPTAWKDFQERVDNMTSSNPYFTKRMKALQKNSYVYCCKDVCPTVTAALGSALGYANYIEVVITVIAIFVYMRVFGGTMTDAAGNGTPMSFKQMMSVANEEETDAKTTATAAP